MDAKEALFVLCRNGVFFLPERVVQSLSFFVSNGSLYLRQEEEVLTISTQRLIGGYRRALGPRFRVPMFRLSRKLAIVDFNESLQIMEVR
jgi:hypothetical protein